MPLTEAQWQRQITDYATLNGWKWYHPHDSRKSKEGWPDLALWTVQPRQFSPLFLLVEVKKQSEDPTDEQAEVIAELQDVGVDVRVWRPSDWPEVQETLRR